MIQNADGAFGATGFHQSPTGKFELLLIEVKSTVGGDAVPVFSEDVFAQALREVPRFRNKPCLRQEDCGVSRIPLIQRKRTDPIPASTEYANSRIVRCERLVVGIRASQQVRQNSFVRDASSLRKRRSDLTGRFDDVGELQNTVKSFLVDNLAQCIRAESIYLLLHLSRVCLGTLRSSATERTAKHVARVFHPGVVSAMPAPAHRPISAGNDQSASAKSR